jgi:hypothetical protein
MVHDSSACEVTLYGGLDPTTIPIVNFGDTWQRNIPQPLNLEGYIGYSNKIWGHPGRGLQSTTYDGERVVGGLFGGVEIDRDFKDTWMLAVN